MSRPAPGAGREQGQVMVQMTRVPLAQRAPRAVALLLSVPAALVVAGILQSPAIAESPDPNPVISAAVVPSEPTGSQPPASATPEQPLTPEPPSSPAAPLDQAAASAPAPAPAPAQAVVSHVVLAPITEPGAAPTYFPVDTAMTGLGRLTTVRIRYQLRNDSPGDASLTPLLQFGSAGSFNPVPTQLTVGVPFHATTEWVKVPTGTEQGPLGEPLAATSLLLPPDLSVPAPGYHSMGANPAPALQLPAGSTTEAEFSIRVSPDAPYGTTFDFRLTDNGAELPGALAQLQLAADPDASQDRPSGQDGQPQEDPVTMPAAQARVRYQLLAPADPVGPAKAAGGVRPASRARPAAGAVDDSAGSAMPAAGAGEWTSPHGPQTLTTDSCAACHRTHTGTGTALTAASGARSTLCLTCHDGTGANTNVGAAYAALPKNRLVAPVLGSDGSVVTLGTREIFQHSAGIGPADPAEPGVHTLGTSEEFRGVRNRHSDCTDCHDPHNSNPAAPTSSTSGWTQSGRIQGAAGVAVTNGAANSAPTYQFLDGQGTKIQAEYQLCFKCHSGYTQLPANTGYPLSQYALDKGIEFNPANSSFHPVEAAGRNTSQKMADSLSMASDYKLWNFTVGSTIRCLNCHADSATRAAGVRPATNADLPNHGSTNRGILLGAYQDRTLRPTTAAYNGANFELCYLCHSDLPFKSGGDVNFTATNFGLHRKHVGNLGGEGSSTSFDIDTPGAGSGNALCAECHFRLHSNTFKVGSQVLTGTNLVNFAPNVTGVGGSPPGYTDTRTGGSCNLTCHGKTHENLPYTNN